MRKLILTMAVGFFGVFPSFIRWFFWDLIRSFSQRPFILIRYAIAKNEMAACGENVYFGVNVTLKNTKKMRVGSNVSIHDNCYIDAYGEIVIGDNVSIAHATTIMTTNHTWEDPSRPIKYNPAALGEVEIADDVWIGCGARILAGVQIQSRSVVAASAVLTAGYYDGCAVYGGIPAKRLKTI